MSDPASGIGRLLAPELQLCQTIASITSEHAAQIKNGRIDGVQTQEDETAYEGGSDDLRRKLRAIAGTQTFAKLDGRNQRLLAFAAQWFTAEPGEFVFQRDDVADAAYLCVEGTAQLVFPNEDGSYRHVSHIEPGRLIGDMAVLMDEPRPVSLQGTTEVLFLRIGAAEFKSVIEADKTALLTLLRTVSGHLQNAAGLLAETKTEIPSQAAAPAVPKQE